MSARAGAKRHMPNLHTARPHLQSHSLAAHLIPLGRGDSLCTRKGSSMLESTFSLDWDAYYHSVSSSKLVVKGCVGALRPLAGYEERDAVVATIHPIPARGFRLWDI